MNLRQLFFQHIAQTSNAPIAIEVAKAEGSRIWDTEGKEYIDLIAGISVCNIGHRHPKVIKAIKKQLDDYMHVLVYGEMIQSPQVVRGDVNSIRIGNKVNIQDGAVIHCTFKRTKAVIWNNVSIGHNAIVHGCTVEDNVLIGMGAIVMDNAEIGTNSIIAAGAVVLESTKVDAGSIYAGVPAKKVKDISQELIHNEINRIAENYVRYADWFRGQDPK